MKLETNNNNRDRTGGGFTLVEVMIGVVIMSVMAVALYGGLTYAFDMVKLTRENVRATQIMQDKIEAIRLCNWDQINQAGFIPTRFQEPFFPMQGTGGMKFDGAVQIAPPSNSLSYGADLRVITVTVGWVSGGVVRNRQLQTMVSRYGLQNYLY